MKSITMILALGFTAGALVAATACSSSDNTTNTGSPADGGGTILTDGGSAADAACVEAPNCVSCQALYAGDVGTTCLCDGTPSSSTLSTELFQCSCQQNCATECADSCSGAALATQACIACTESKCATDFAACIAKDDGHPITPVDSGMTMSGTDAGDDDSGSTTDSGTDSGVTDAGSDADAH